MENFKISVRDGSTSLQLQNIIAGGENSQQSTSAESNKPIVNNTPLLPPDEAKYLRLYGRQLFDDMIENEYKSQFNALLTN